MPPNEPSTPEKSYEQVVAEFGVYPLEAFIFLNEGLGYAVNKYHGKRKNPDQNMHVTGQQLCEGLREFAIRRWGYLAAVVLKRWGITKTLDFGRMVFWLIENGKMQKTDQDTLDDFRDVYDLKAALESSYKIEVRP